MIALLLMNRSEVFEYVGWHKRPLDQKRLHNRSRLRHFRWLMGHTHCFLMNLVVHTTEASLELEFLHEPIFDATFVIFDVLGVQT